MQCLVCIILLRTIELQGVARYNTDSIRTSPTSPLASYCAYACGVSYATKACLSPAHGLGRGALGTMALFDVASYANRCRCVHDFLRLRLLMFEALSATTLRGTNLVVVGHNSAKVCLHVLLWVCIACNPIDTT